jgi:hypothetical protein
MPEKNGFFFATFDVVWLLKEKSELTFLQKVFCMPRLTEATE